MSYKEIVLCILLLTPLSLTAGAFDKLIVFGDSLSDNGNLASLADFIFLTNPNLPYHKGFTNGPTAVEHLAKSLVLPLDPSLYLTTPPQNITGNNFAVAGAKAAGIRGIDLTTQFAAFLTSPVGNISKDTLYIIFIGGNDIRDMRDQKNEKMAHDILNTAASNIKSILSNLVNAGAAHIMVVNSPDIGKIPETQMLAQATNDHNLIRRASKLTDAYNEKLAEIVKHTEKRKDIDIVLFDVQTFFDGLVNNGQAYLFSNTKDACFTSDFNSISFLSYYPNCNKDKLDNNAYVYFDEIHPSQRVHERVGRAMFAAIPEPN
jgi:phospholipase/lecithinase/hemolysin